MYWTSRVTVPAKAYRLVPSGLTPGEDFPIAGAPSGVVLGGSQSPAASPFSYPITPESQAISRLLFDPSSTGYRKELVTNGKSIFEITWSVSVSTTQKFSNPKIESIQHVETIWE